MASAFLEARGVVIRPTLQLIPQPCPSHAQLRPDLLQLTAWLRFHPWSEQDVSGIRAAFCEAILLIVPPPPGPAQRTEFWLLKVQGFCGDWESLHEGCISCISLLLHLMLLHLRSFIFFYIGDNAESRLSGSQRLLVSPGSAFGALTS